MTISPLWTSRVPELALIVDADEDTQELYKVFLIPRRYVVITARDGAEALRKASCDVPDIIVTETQLPVMDGYSLCHLLRAQRRTEAVPIVVLTADTRTVQLERAREAGADAVLIKPCLPERLFMEMQNLRERSRALRARADEIRHLANARIRRSAELIARSTALVNWTDQPDRGAYSALPGPPERRSDQGDR
jgi:DNA-binding response OmpR family regulator